MFAWGWQTWGPRSTYRTFPGNTPLHRVLWRWSGPHFSKIARRGHPRDLLLRFTFEFHMWATRLSFPSAGGAWPILCGFSPRVGIPDFEPPGILTWFLPQRSGITCLAV